MVGLIWSRGVSVPNRRVKRSFVHPKRYSLSIRSPSTNFNHFFKKLITFSHFATYILFPRTSVSTVILHTEKFCPTTNSIRLKESVDKIAPFRIFSYYFPFNGWCSLRKCFPVFPCKLQYNKGMSRVRLKKHSTLYDFFAITLATNLNHDFFCFSNFSAAAYLMHNNSLFYWLAIADIFLSLITRNMQYSERIFLHPEHADLKNCFSMDNILYGNQIEGE